MLYLIDCNIVYLCSHGSFSCCIGSIVALFICALIGLHHVALYWLWQCLSAFFCVFLFLHWIYFDIVYLCSYGSSSCCIGLIVALFICALIGLHHVALYWMWQCLSAIFCIFSVFCIVLIVTDFICFLMVLPHVALDWLWHCLSVFLWFFLKLHLIDSNIICLFSFGSSSCCIGFFVKLFVFVLMVLPHVALDWLWYCFSVFLWFHLRLHWIDCRINYLCSHGSS